MLNAFDDYPIHQTPDPIAHPTTGDRNFYDRYFFNGYAHDGSVFFAVALGVYPNREVMDAAFSLVRDGVQTSVHASRRAPEDRGETRCGPVTVEVLEPMRRLRVTVGPNDADLTASLVFTARSVPVEEPGFFRRSGPRTTMNYTRFTQFGRWDGWIEHAGERVEVAGAEVWGVRDRSWGVRPIGEREVRPPGAAPQFFWLWAPLSFHDRCLHFDVQEDESGRRWHSYGGIIGVGEGAETLPAGGDGAVEVMAGVDHRIDWAPGTRRARKAEILLIPPRGERLTVSLEPILTFQMLGIGYLHPEWSHGVWKGPEEVGVESWRLADLDPLAPQHVHVQQLCRARLGEHEGVGVLEQLVIGPHEPSGFTDILDGASA